MREVVLIPGCGHHLLLLVLLVFSILVGAQDKSGLTNSILVVCHSARGKSHLGQMSLDDLFHNAWGSWDPTSKEEATVARNGHWTHKSRVFCLSLVQAMPESIPDSSAKRAEEKEGKQRAWKKNKQESRKQTNKKKDVGGGPVEWHQKWLRPH